MRNVLTLVILAAMAHAVLAAEAPVAVGPVPSARQLASQADEIYGFAHFGVNTFTDAEWGSGSEKESIFNPTDFDADQIVRAFKDGGMKGVIITAKHHDGFCLWPSAYTEHSVKNSPWKGGHGDVVREIADACHRQGIKFGFYLSPWDRSHPEYGRPGYLVYYKNQLRELLTNYGPIFEIWLDGANGGKGYYGGANETRKVDATRYYQWPDAWVSMIRQLQPDCVIHSDFGPDNRWGGSESGTQPLPCWSTLQAHDLTFNSKWKSPRNMYGEHPGDVWLPPESDVSIRPGWFYHAGDDRKVKGAKTLLNLYYQSVGRGSNLLLNVPPDRRGRIADIDVETLKQFKSLKDRTFAVNLAASADVKADSVRGGDSRFDGAKAVDGDPATFWCTDDAVKAAEMDLAWPAPVRYDVVNLQEYIQLGQRVEGYEVDHWDGAGWVADAVGQSVGHRALVKLAKPVTTSKVRLKITAAAACPAISEFGLYLEPEK